MWTARSFLAVYWLKSQGSKPLQHLLWEFRHAQCSDPRDKVYAFLGLIEGILTEDMEADYSKSLRQLYAAIGRLDPACEWFVQYRLLGLDEGHGLPQTVQPS